MDRDAALKIPGGTDRPGISAPLYPLRFWVVLSLLLLFCIVLKLPTLSSPHEEPDERVYMALATRMLHAGSYNLAGTEILKELPPGVYDRPLFHHPPLFPAALVPFVYLGVEKAGVVVSWLGHFLCIISVALIGRRIAFAYGLATDRHALVSWLPVIGICLDPLLIFISRKLWIDSILAGLCAVSIAAFFCARYSQRRSFLLLLGGLLFGLANLTKITALIFTPLVVYLILTPEGLRRPKISELCLGFLPAALLVLPWYVIFYHTYGAIVPSWTKPDDWLIQHYPFVRVALARTPLYYFLKLALIAPVSVISIGAYVVTRSLWTSKISLVPVLWFVLCFATISYLGLRGYTFQMRYIAQIVPSIYLMFYAPLALFPGNRDIVSVAGLLLLIYGGMTGAIYLLASNYDEVYSLFEIVGWVRL